MSRKFYTKSGGNSINKSLTIYLHAPCIHLSEDFTKSLKYLLFIVLIWKHVATLQIMKKLPNLSKIFRIH